jgi:hypothetical protein
LKNGRFLAPPRARRMTTMLLTGPECGKGVILRYIFTSGQGEIRTASHIASVAHVPNIEIGSGRAPARPKPGT